MIDTARCSSTDPREIFANELIKIGVPKELSFNIALDAGSSQIIVDKEYIDQFNISKKMKRILLQKAKDFYLGNNEISWRD